MVRLLRSACGGVRPEWWDRPTQAALSTGSQRSLQAQRNRLHLSCCECAQASSGQHERGITFCSGPRHFALTTGAYARLEQLDHVGALLRYQLLGDWV